MPLLLTSDGSKNMEGKREKKKLEGEMIPCITTPLPSLSPHRFRNDLRCVFLFERFDTLAPRSLSLSYIQ